MTYSFSSAGSERDLTPDELEDITERYWHSDEARQDIEASTGLTSAAFGKQLPALESGTKCPHCAAPMVWRSRLAKHKDAQFCSGCQHASGWCSCAPCNFSRRAEEQRREADELDRRQAAVAAWLAECGGSE